MIKRAMPALKSLVEGKDVAEIKVSSNTVGSATYTVVFQRLAELQSGTFKGQ